MEQVGDNDLVEHDNEEDHQEDDNKCFSYVALVMGFLELIHISLNLNWLRFRYKSENNSQDNQNQDTQTPS